ncbi:MAG: hypothetical protein WCA78_02035 [Rhizomicrobium sp.]
MNNPTLFSAVFLTASAFITSGACADCDSTRWTDPNNSHNRGQYPSVEGVENTYLDQNPDEMSGRINAEGNIQIITVTLVNDKDGLCTIDMIWEVNCERQEFRLLRSNTFYDSDWPAEKDEKIGGDKVWGSYNTPMGTRRIGNLANQFCARKYQLPRMSS